MTPTSPPLFTVKGLRCFELGAEDVAELQRFFDVNPQYFFAVNGEAPSRDEAQEELQSELPAGWSYTKKWLLGFVNESNLLVGMANLVSDLLAPHVWHIGLFIVATARHGNGDAQILYRGLEDWVIRQGAHWLRLGVVEGNPRAEVFWQNAGFVQVRKRNGVEMGKRVNTLRVMAKPLSGGTLAEYLRLVVRDQSDL